MNMREHLKDYDENKLKIVLEIKEAYNNKEISLNEAKKILKEKVGTLKPYEIALAEQELKELVDDECRKEDIQAMLLLFEDVMDTSRPNLDINHPIMNYYRENDELRKIFAEIEDLIQYPVIKNQWLELYERLDEFKKHLSRKQNQLYPVLEKKGFDRPTTTMWLLDNFVRDEITKAHQLIKSDCDDEFIEMQKTVIDDLNDLITKEETVLYPTSLAMISDQEFEEMELGDNEIGFSWINVKQKQKSDIKPSNETFNEELFNLLNKYGYNKSDNKLEVANGKLTLEQINLIYKHMPVDISYVDENELVCFYSDSKHRIFPRSKNVIGRDVKNCHPRSSVHVVEEIIEKFRSGEKDSVDFWINKEDIFIYIYYVAVRDENGKFKGVLEMMQDCTHIRSLVGSRTLLSWDEDKGDNVEKTIIEKEEINIPNIDMNSIDGDTKLVDLFNIYPFLRKKMIQISPKFKMLETPLAKVMLPKATIKKASERVNIPESELIDRIKQLIDEQ